MNMAQTFFFYDLETSGLNPRQDRIMQFAGQRTDMDLQPIGEPYNILVTLNDDTLPSPDALMVTGITPQKTVEEGYTEAQFARMLSEEIFTTDTIAVGFNNIRFDDEFIRHLFWRIPCRNDHSHKQKVFYHQHSPVFGPISCRAFSANSRTFAAGSV